MWTFRLQQITICPATIHAERTLFIVSSEQSKVKYTPKTVPDVSALLVDKIRKHLVMRWLCSIHLLLSRGVENSLVTAINSKNH